MNTMTSAHGSVSRSEHGTAPTIAVVILNYNGWRFTLNCLKSLRGGTSGSTPTFVIDNGSADGSANFLRPNLEPPRCRLVQLVGLLPGRQRATRKKTLARSSAGERDGGILSPKGRLGSDNLHRLEGSRRRRRNSFRQGPVDPLWSPGGFHYSVGYQSLQTRTWQLKPLDGFDEIVVNRVEAFTFIDWKRPFCGSAPFT